MSKIKENRKQELLNLLIFLNQKDVEEFDKSSIIFKSSKIASKSVKIDLNLNTQNKIRKLLIREITNELIKLDKK